MYGVVGRHTTPELPEGVEGHRPRLVPSGKLAAIVGPLEGAEVRASRRNLVAHTEVLRSVLPATVLPMAFGVVVSGEAGVEEHVIEPFRERLEQLLVELEGLVELTVKVVAEEQEILRVAVGNDAQVSRARAALRQRDDYALRIRLGERVAGAVERLRQELTVRVLDLVAPYAVEHRVDTPTAEEMLMKASLLVRAPEVPRVEEAVEAFAAKEEWLRVVLTGPLPPFGFVDLAPAEGAAA